MSNMMEYRGYHAKIEFDADDGIFVGEVFGIADTLCFHGSSVEELRAMFEESIDNYLELCEKIGKEPDKEFKGTFNVRVSPDLHRDAALEAAKKGISLNQFVQNCIEQSFNTDKQVKVEKIIYIPYSEKTVSLEGDMNNGDNYIFKNEFEVMRKENVIYEESLS